MQPCIIYSRCLSQNIVDGLDFEFLNWNIEIEKPLTKRHKGDYITIIDALMILLTFSSIFEFDFLFKIVAS